MKHIQFANGDRTHAIGLGTWKATGEVAKKAVKEAIYDGYRHIDTAAIYENEEAIGEAIQEVMSQGLVRREDLFVTSKLWNDAHHPENVLPALQDSLRKLQLEYLDLYLIHWPVHFKAGVSFPSGPDDYVSTDELPMIATWRAMEAIKAQGLARHIGVSNFSVLKLENLVSQAEHKPEMNQVELHPLLQQNELKRYCDKHHILLTGYSPLGSGDRNEQMKAADEPSLFELEVIKDIADKNGITPAQVLISWHANRGTAVIPKSTSKAHLMSNLEAGKIDLSDADMAAIAKLDRNYRFITGKFFEMPEKGYVDIYDEA